MMYFENFDIKDVDGINKFLAKNSDGIPVHGTKFLEGGRLCFLYTTPDEKGQKRDALVNSINDSIGKWRAELLGHVCDISYYRELLEKKGIKPMEKNIIELAAIANNLRLHIKHAEECKAKIINGDFAFMENEIESIEVTAPVEVPKKGKK